MKKIGITIPEMVEADIEKERIVKEYIEGDTILELVLKDQMKAEYIEQVKHMCGLLYAENTNIDYFPTNFIPQGDECNDYMQEWNFENWGVKYWSKTPEFMQYIEERKQG